MKNYIIVFAGELFISIIYGAIRGFSLLHFLNCLFGISLLGLCIGLFMMMFSDGAYSIMGHSFRKFNYMIAPNSVKQAMDEDPTYRKELRIRNEKYELTKPILVVSLVLLIISLGWSMVY